MKKYFYFAMKSPLSSSQTALTNPNRTQRAGGVGSELQQQTMLEYLLHDEQVGHEWMFAGNF